MTDIFISYSRKNLVLAAKLAAALDDLGYVVWWDRRNLRGGQAFAREIERVIRQASCVIVIWSCESAKSEWVYAEASLAYGQGNLLTAVYDEADIPLPFNTRHNEDLKHWRGDLRHAGLQKLLQSVSRCCSQAAHHKHSVYLPQTPDTVLSAPAKPGLAWSSVLSVLLGTVSLAVAGGAFYLQSETQIVDDWLSSLGLNQGVLLEPETGTDMSSGFVKSLAVAKPVKPELKPVLKHQLMITVQPEKVYVQAVITVDGELWVPGNRYKAGRQYKVIVSAVGYETEVRNVEIVNLDVPLPFVLKPLVDPVVASSPNSEVETIDVKPKRFKFAPDMIEIPATSFIPANCPEVRRRVKGTCAEIKLAAFAIAKTEVTVRQFRRFVAETAYKTTAEEQNWCWGVHNSEGQWGRFPQATWRQASFAQDDDYPVTCVSGRDVRAYIGWLNQKTGTHYALPTEMQWEYAALVGTQKTPDRSAGPCGYANVADQAARKIYSAWKTYACHDGYIHAAPVGRMSAGDNGLDDMYGNVWEWIRAQDGDEMQVIRGGSWGDNPQVTDSTDRAIWEENYPSEDVGFRLVKKITSSP